MTGCDVAHFAPEVSGFLAVVVDLSALLYENRAPRSDSVQQTSLVALLKRKLRRPPARAA
jgi:hypothetical protein